MDPIYSVLLDAPAEVKKRIQIARLGPVKDPRYGDFEITRENAENWKRNLEHLPGGRALIDFEHRSEKSPRDSIAAGWITGIDLDGDKVMADAEWTDKGEEAIRNKRYLFLSPAYGTHRDEHGNAYEDTLCSTALTNKPALGSLPMLTLASEERVSEALDADPAARFHVRALDGEYGEHVRALVTLDVSAGDRRKAADAGHALPDGSYPIRNGKELHSAAVLAASGHGDVAGAKKLIRRRAKDLGVDVTTLPGFASKSADSPRQMETDILIKTLDLEDGADDAKILEALAALKATAAKPAEPAEVKTLEQQAADEGKRLLDAAEFTQLKTQAAAGEAAMKRLHEQTFEHTFDAALTDGRVTPAEKDSLHHFFTLDADATIKLIEDREPIVQAKPTGDPVIDLEQITELDDSQRGQLAAGGVVPDSVLLDQKIRKHMKDKGLGESAYAKVLDQTISGELSL